MDLSRKDQSRAPSGDPAPQIDPKGSIPGGQPTLPPWFQPNPHIDRTHDVPLAAAALSDVDGQMYGIAIDKDAPNKPEYDPYIFQHEWQEHHYMQDLMANGMEPTEAYHKAHDHITPMESAAVQAKFGEQGLEDYKQYWRDVSSVAGTKEDPNRHPDAHTTIHGLDEAELGRKFDQPQKAEFDTSKLPPYMQFLGSMVQSYMNSPSWVERAKALQANEANMTPQQQMQARLDLVSGFGGAGIMAGEEALLGNASMLSRAVKMESAGKDATSIHANTGWFKGADSKWRFEISDDESRLQLAPLLKQPFGGTDLKDIFDHPTLFDNYPNLENIKVIPAPKGAQFNGSWNRYHNTIMLNLNRETADEVKGTLLHEIQHAVQDYEGFARGGSFHDLLPSQKTRQGLTDEEWNEAHSRALDEYYSTMGEVEARNTQDRRNMSSEERGLLPPFETEDVSRNLQRPSLQSYGTIPEENRGTKPGMFKISGGASKGGTTWIGTIRNDPNKLKQLQTLFDKGMSYAEIAKEMGVSRNTIAGLASRLKLKPSAPGLPSLPKVDLPEANEDDYRYGLKYFK